MEFHLDMLVTGTAESEDEEARSVRGAKVERILKAVCSVLASLKNAGAGGAIIRNKIEAPALVARLKPAGRKEGEAVKKLPAKRNPIAKALAKASNWTSAGRLRPSA